MNIRSNLHISTTVLMLSILSACGGGGSDSGGPTTELLRCVLVQDTTVTNNCAFNVNVRYFTSEVTATGASETVTELSPGQVLNVAPFDSQTSSGVPACQAPLRPSQLFMATRTITCG